MHSDQSWNHGQLDQARRSPMKPDAVWPRVQVIVTSYNYERYVIRALESVAMQEYPNLECVIVDDGSSDNSVPKIERWMATRSDRRFRLIRSLRNLGELGACALGLAQGEGEFIAFLDSDDYWIENHLQTHIRAHLNACIACGVTCSDMFLVDAESRMLSGTIGAKGFAAAMRGSTSLEIPVKSIPQWRMEGPVVPGGAMDRGDFPSIRFIPASLFQWHWTMSSALVFRRAILELMLPSEVPDGRFGADHFMLHACHYFSGSILIGAALGAYRRHGDNGYSSLPVYGGGAASAHYDTFSHTTDNFLTLLEHVLDRRDFLESLFGAPRIRNLISGLTGYLLRKRVRIDSAQLSEYMGHYGMIAARVGEFCRRL